MRLSRGIGRPTVVVRPPFGFVRLLPVGLGRVQIIGDDLKQLRRMIAQLLDGHRTTGIDALREGIPFAEDPFRIGPNELRKAHRKPPCTGSRAPSGRPVDQRTGRATAASPAGRP